MEYTSPTEAIGTCSSVDANFKGQQGALSFPIYVGACHWAIQKNNKAFHWCEKCGNWPTTHWANQHTGKPKPQPQPQPQPRGGARPYLPAATTLHGSDSGNSFNLNGMLVS